MENDFMIKDAQDCLEDEFEITKEKTLFTFSKVLELFGDMSNEDYELWFEGKGKPVILSNELAEYILDFIKFLSEEDIRHLKNGEAKLQYVKLEKKL